MNSASMLAIGIIIIPSLIGLAAILHHFITIHVEEYHSVVMTSFGKWVKQFDQSGEHFEPRKILPWVKFVTISRQSRELKLDQICIYDKNGTSLMIELFMEFRIYDPKNLLFSVEDWKASMKSVCLHVTTSVLSGLQFEEILKNRSTLELKIRENVLSDLSRWGIELNHLLIQNLSLLPEVSRQVLQGVGAHLEKKKALIEEFARMEVLKIDAETSQDVSIMKGEASSQMSLAIGNALESIRNNPEVYDAYQKLYGLSLVKPEQTIVFQGFTDGVSVSDASLLLGNRINSIT